MLEQNDLATLDRHLVLQLLMAQQPQPQQQQLRTRTMREDM